MQIVKFLLNKIKAFLAKLQTFHSLAMVQFFCKSGYRNQRKAAIAHQFNAVYREIVLIFTFCTQFLVLFANLPHSKV